MTKKLVSLVLSVVLVTSLLSGCGSNATKDSLASNSGESDSALTDSNATGAAKYPKFITYDVFDSLANYQGIMTGWYAKIVKEKFNMELNIIAPNVAGGGDTLFQTRSAAGELGDLIIIGAEGGRMQDTVTAGLLYDVSKLFSERKNVMKYKAAIDSLNSMVEGDAIYGIPSSVSEQPATNPSEGLDLTFGPYVRWDAYKAIGYPQIKTLEDFIPVFKDMQKAVPKSKTGKKTYAISLFKDWDGNMMCMAKQPTCFYGYDEVGFVLAKADGSDYQSIIDPNSMYNRVLKFYFDANQAGLMDPESTTQNYDTMYTKYQDGQILYSPWPWLGQSAFNTPENKAAGIGFMVAPIDDMKVFSYGCMPVGNKTFIGIGSKAEEPERLADFIDWLYSPDGVLISAAQTSNASGPEGLTWKMENGKPVLTDFGKKAFYEGGDTPVPEEWGGGSWKDGVSALNFPTVLPSDINPNTNFPYNYTLWDSVLEANKTPLDIDWQSKMGAKTTLEYLQNKNQVLVAPGCSFIAPAEDSQITALRGQCKAIIVEYSWKMVFAANEAEFQKLQKEMQETVMGLGYDKVLEVDMKNAKDQNTAREAAVAASK